MKLQESLSSLENNKVKYIKKLIWSSSFRKEEKAFVIEGLRLCGDAVESNLKFKMVLCTKKILQKNEPVINKIMALSCEHYIISDKIATHLTDTVNPQGLFCVVRTLDNIRCGDRINVVKKGLALENIQDPANLGAILRSAEAFGIESVFLSDDCVDVYNGKVLRGSMGAVFRLHIFVQEKMDLLLKMFNDNGINTYATVPDRAAIAIDDVDFRKPSLMVIGNEGNGLRNSTMNMCSERVTIPMVGMAESLNASVAAGIIMWAMSREKDINIARR